MEILSKFTPHVSWRKIDPNEYVKNGIMECDGAKLLSAYNVGKLYESINTVSLYKYDHTDNFFEELKNSYNELQLDLEKQDAYGIFPISWEQFDTNKMLSVIKLIAYPVMKVVDIFFEYQNEIYDFHTYIPDEEKNLKISYLHANYPNIRHIIDEINNIKD